jgi:hypothetical protein
MSEITNYVAVGERNLNITQQLHTEFWLKNV